MKKNYLLIATMLFAGLSVSAQYIGKPLGKDRSILKKDRNVIGESSPQQIYRLDEADEFPTPFAPDETIIFQEGFEGAFPPAGWQNLDEDGDNFSWQQEDDIDGFITAYEGDFFARSDSWSGGPLTPDNWLITSQISLPTVAPDEIIVLEFAVIGTEWEDNFEFLEAYISNTGNQVSDFMTSIWADDLPTEWTTISLDATALQGQDLYLAFRHHNVTDVDVLGLDDIKVKVLTPKDNDLAIVDYYVGEYTMTPEFYNYQENVQAGIANIGANTQNNVYMNVVADGFNEDSDVVAAIDPQDGDVFDVDFIAPTNLGDYTITLTANQDELDDDMDDNVIEETLNISENTLAKDFADHTGDFWAGLEQNYNIGNIFFIESETAGVAESVTFVASSFSEANTNLTVSLHLYDEPNDVWNVVATSNQYTLTAGDISPDQNPNNFVYVTVEFEDSYLLNQGDVVIASVDHNTAATNDFAYITANKLTNAVAGVLSTDGGGSWGTIGNEDVPIVRMNLRECHEATAVANDPTCNGANDGSIDVEITNFTPGDYTISWSGTESGSEVVNTNTYTIDNLIAGMYDVVIDDGSGCVYEIAQIELVDPAIFSLDVSSVNATGCGVEDGIIQIEILNSTTTEYTVSWDGTATGSFTTTDLQTEIPGLAAGSYDVTVTDENGCSVEEIAVTVSEDGAVTISIEVVSEMTCSGSDDAVIEVTSEDDISDYTFTWNTTEQGESITVGAGTFTVTGEGNGCTTNTPSVEILDGDPLEISIDVTPMTCSGSDDAVLEVTSTEDISSYTFEWSTTETGTSITVGEGTYTVEGDGECNTTVPEVTVVDGDELELSIAVISEVTCNGSDDAVLEVTSTEDISNYTFEWSTTETGTSITVGAGTYSVEGDGECNTNAPEITVTEPDAVDVSGTVTGDEISVSATGGAGNYTYDWTGPNGFTATGAVITVPENGDYTVTVTDENGCESEETYTVTGVSVESHLASSINVFPNPTSSVLNFDMGDVSARFIHIYDMTGKKINVIDANNTFVVINVSTLAKGLYIYQITNQDGAVIKTDKFNVMK